MIDLGAWASETYRVPGEAGAPEDDRRDEDER
jgi:endogenous inhibitor of DNA gyrase (YacG/DUF329 family)